MISSWISDSIEDEVWEEAGCGGGEGATGAGGEEYWAEGASLLSSFSTASLSLLSSNSLCLARRMSFISLVLLRSTSVCFNFVLRIPSSILVCSCWNDLGDVGIVSFFLYFLVFVFSDGFDEGGIGRV